MGKIKKSFFLAVLIFLSFFSFMIAGAQAYTTKAASNNDNTFHKQKVIAVVYDNSGSMLNENRSPYAKYALQGLMSVVDSKDLMCVFPLNYNAGEQKIRVDLSAQDRGKVVEDIIAKSAFIPQGAYYTPPGAVKTAVDWLAEEEQGMNKYEQVQGKEFWLIMLSDGEFQEFKRGQLITYDTCDTIRENIADYVGLQTIYFGMCANDGMKIDELVNENPAVTAYYTNSAEEIISAMQNVTNRLTGRYTLLSGEKFSSNKVVVDLSECNFSISSLAVLAQGNGDIQLESVECSTKALINMRECSISVNEGVKVSGYSSIIVPAKSGGYLNKDKITLTFSSAPESLSILAEPAIKLSANLQHFNEGKWKDVTIDEINATFGQGETIRTKYKLLDGMTGNELSFSEVVASASYGGKEFNQENGFQLQTGKKEITLLVKVTIGESEYTLFESWLSDVEENPTFFRLEDTVTKDGDKVKVEYKVIYDNQKVDHSQLQGKDASFKWELVQIKDPQGNDVAYESCNLSSDGIITIIYKIQPDKFGTYTTKVKVTNLENRRYRVKETELDFYPKNLTLVPSTTDGMTLTTNQLNENTDAIEFILTADGQPLNFKSQSLRYEFKIDGVDLTNYTEADGNVLKFVPSSESLTSSMMKIGTKNIQVKVWSITDDSITVSAESSLTVINSTYFIEVTEENNQVDIYNLKDCGAKIYYRIKLDGKYLTAEQLQTGLDSGRIKLDYDEFGWASMLPADVDTQVVEKGGSAYIVCTLGTNWWKPIAGLFGSFIATGEKTFTLSMDGCSASGVFNLLEVTFFSRLWRWLVILLIIYFIVHIILWIVGFFIVQPLPQGFIVNVELSMKRNKEIDATAYEVNLDAGSKIRWHIIRLLPFKEFKNQPEMQVEAGRSVTFSISDDGMEMISISDETREYRDTGDYLNNLKHDCRTYRETGIFPQYSSEKPVPSKKYFKTLNNQMKPIIENDKPVGLTEDICYVCMDGKFPSEVIYFVRIM